MLARMTLSEYAGLEAENLFRKPYEELYANINGAGDVTGARTAYHEGQNQ